ncbi:MAG: 7-cyano-7-deazaguanine synthase QueC, partial [Pirellulaceae bacterium]
MCLMESQNSNNAVVLLSGGLDSATVLAMAIADGLQCHAISFRYGQRHERELEAARIIAEVLGVIEHVVVDIDLASFGGSALTGEFEVPTHSTVDEISDGIPLTYVPARNTVFLSLGIAFAETRRASRVFIGVNALDYSGYPDCRPEFIEAFQLVAQLGTQAGIETPDGITIEAPLIEMTKAEIIMKGIELGLDYGLTTSCYDPVGQMACGACDACLLRKKGFRENGLEDPVSY